MGEVEKMCVFQWKTGYILEQKVVYWLLMT